jgi:predicted aconitase with swiveling domain
MGRVIEGRVLVAGEAAGELLVATEPLSFWGGYDPATGEIIDRRHPLAGQVARGRVLALPATKGSSTTTAILLEAIRQGHAPAAIVTAQTDSFLALASVVAEEMYGTPIPLVELTPAEFGRLRSGVAARIEPDGKVILAG